MEEKKHTGRDVLKTMMNVTVVILLLLVIAYVALTLYARMVLSYEENLVQEGAQMVSEEPAEIPIYTQEEADEMVEQARQEVMDSFEEELEEAREESRRGTLQALVDGLASGKTLLEALRFICPQQLVVASKGRYHFVDIDQNLKMHDRTQDHLVMLDSGVWEYEVDEQVLSHKGIDVSSHQGDIKWDLVAKDGVEFAFVRALFRGYGSGKLVEDECFETNFAQAKEQGIAVGAYIFTQAVNEEEMREEVELVLQKMKPFGTGFPIAIDVERVANAETRMEALTVEERTNLILLFCDLVEEAGYKPLVYYNTEMSALYLDLAKLENVEKWFASYSSNMYYPYEHLIWQYSEKGSVDGIKGDVDLDMSFSEFWK